MKDDFKGKIIKLQKIGTYKVCKVSLSCFSDKRYVLDNRVNGLAYFHKNKKLIIYWFVFIRLGKNMIKLTRSWFSFHKTDKRFMRLIKSS